MRYFFEREGEYNGLLGFDCSEAISLPYFIRRHTHIYSVRNSCGRYHAFIKEVAFPVLSTTTRIVMRQSRLLHYIFLPIRLSGVLP